tara:strand:+ start:12975 stop:13322 length:348 start_codon:yes stop_codon:yes gene_type:complete
MITNNEQVLSHEEIYCKNIFSQGRGLMFRSRKNLVMEFKSPRKISLHMWFVKYPIDVFLLDAEMKVVEVKRGFKPWSLWKSSEKGKYLVEMAESSCRVELGDVLEFRNQKLGTQP